MFQGEKTWKGRTKQRKIKKGGGDVFRGERTGERIDLSPYE
jgi:hypothetical protein